MAMGEIQAYTDVETEKNRKRITRTNTDKQNVYKRKETKKIILIKSKENKNTNSEEIKEKVLKVLKPQKDKIRVKNIRKARDNALLIDMEAEEDIEEVKKIDFNEVDLKIE